jgi:hypothetical protein
MNDQSEKQISDKKIHKCFVVVSSYESKMKIKIMTLLQNPMILSIYDFVIHQVKSFTKQSIIVPKTVF